MTEEDDEFFGGLYEDGHWVWDDNTQALVFMSDRPPVSEEVIHKPKTLTGAIEFREDIDFIEQVRYKRRYQRKLLPGQEDLVTLQDIKDIVIYTAPIGILSPILIDMLHLRTTERFLRALIFCCAYYLQVADEMAFRMLERKVKIRTDTCEILENLFQDNLSDLRILVAKEYCIMLIGGGDTKKFHHMGSNKKRRSLSDKDARLFETFVRMSVQIVYLALGRQKLRQIELECHRIFKSDIFNTVEHTYKTGYLAQMEPEERKVLLGTRVLYERKINTRSPLMNEIFPTRPIDFRMMGLGVVKYEKSKAGSLKSGPRAKSTVKSSKSAAENSSAWQLYPYIVLPDKDSIDSLFPSDFPENSEDGLRVSLIQQRRWQHRLLKYTKPQCATASV